MAHSVICALRSVIGATLLYRLVLAARPALVRLASNCLIQTVCDIVLDLDLNVSRVPLLSKVLSYYMQSSSQHDVQSR